jgi:hypothetical protein
MWLESENQTHRYNCPVSYHTPQNNSHKYYKNQRLTLTNMYGSHSSKAVCKYSVSFWALYQSSFTVFVSNYMSELEFIKFRFISWPIWGYYIYRVSQNESARLREGVPYVKVYRSNSKHLRPKLNGYGDNGQRSLKLWQLLHTYWLPNTY